MIDLLWQYRGSMQHAAIGLLAVACWLKGAGPEKAAGFILVGFVLADRLYHIFFGQAVYHTVDIGHLVTDVLALAAFGWLALQANRVYPLWIFAAQIIATSMHFQRLAFTQIDPLTYAILYRAPSYLQIGLLLAGLAYHVRRGRKYGAYRAWRAEHDASSTGIRQRGPT